MNSAILAIVIAVLTWAAVWAWTVAHQLIIWWVVSVLIEQLPPPTPTSNAFYRYFFSVVQVLAANLKRTTDAVRTGNQPPNDPVTLKAEAKEPEPPKP
jgi:hypothetical protein